MTDVPHTITEADILAQVVASDEPGLPAEAARSLLNLSFKPSAVDRMNELAEKNRLGTLTDIERAEMDNYLRVGNFLNLIQAKARLSLADTSTAS